MQALLILYGLFDLIGFDDPLTLQRLTQYLHTGICSGILLTTLCRANGQAALLLTDDTAAGRIKYRPRLIHAFSAELISKRHAGKQAQRK